MVVALFRRLSSAALMLLVGAGGGSLPLVDGLLFHPDRDDSPGAHYEATSGCHADGCALGSTASDARFAPTLPGPAAALLLPSAPVLLPVPEILISTPLSGSPLSRAPPLFG